MRPLVFVLIILAFVALASAGDGRQATDARFQHDSMPISSAQQRLEIDASVAEIDQEITILAEHLVTMEGEVSLELIRELEALKQEREQRLQDWQQDRARRIVDARQRTEVAP